MRAIAPLALALGGLVACNAIFGLEEVEPLPSGGGNAGGGGAGAGGDGGNGGAGGGGNGGGGGGEPIVGTCDDPIPIDGELSGTLAGAADRVDGICGQGPERVYAFTTDGGAMLVELIPSGNEDLAISIRKECEDPETPLPCCTPSATPGCNVANVESFVCAFAPSCCTEAWTDKCVSLIRHGTAHFCATRTCSNWHGDGVREQAYALTVEAPGETFYIHVQGNTANDAGEYLLRATQATTCMGNQDCSNFNSPHACYGDPGTTGFCQPDQSCLASVVAVPGMNVGDTASGSHNHTGSCSLINPPSHGSGPESVFAFTSSPNAPNGSQFLLDVQSNDPNVDLMLYVREGRCNDGTELACSNIPGDLEQVNFQVAADTLMYIFVDSESDADVGAFTLTITEMPM